MGFLIAIALLAVSSCGVFATVWHLVRARASRTWWLAFALLSIVGLIAGSWLAFSVDYQVSSRMRFVSFPMPLAFHHLENGERIDFVTPAYVMYPGLVANIVAITAMALLPLLIASVVSSRKHKQMNPSGS